MVDYEVFDLGDARLQVSFCEGFLLPKDATNLLAMLWTR